VAVTVGTLVGGFAAPGCVTGAAGTGSGKGGILLAQAASKTVNVPRHRKCHHTPATGPKMKLCAEDGKRHMLLILLEALLAGAILVFIVWWTMFSGRRDGERRDEE
jgi:hypothetical protein